MGAQSRLPARSGHRTSGIRLRYEPKGALRTFFPVTVAKSSCPSPFPLALSHTQVPELFDTFFIVARKSKLIFLHWYHHVTVLLYCWHSFATRSSAGLFFVAMNYGVSHMLLCAGGRRRHCACAHAHSPSSPPRPPPADLPHPTQPFDAGARRHVLLLLPHCDGPEGVVGVPRHRTPNLPNVRRVRSLRDDLLLLARDADGVRHHEGESDGGLRHLLHVPRPLPPVCGRPVHLPRPYPASEGVQAGSLPVFYGRDGTRCGGLLPARTRRARGALPSRRYRGRHQPRVAPVGCGARLAQCRLWTLPKGGKPLALCAPPRSPRRVRGGAGRVSSLSLFSTQLFLPAFPVPRHPLVRRVFVCASRFAASHPFSCRGIPLSARPGQDRHLLGRYRRKPGFSPRSPRALHSFQSSTFSSFSILLLRHFPTHHLAIYLVALFPPLPRRPLSFARTPRPPSAAWEKGETLPIMFPAAVCRMQSPDAEVFSFTDVCFGCSRGMGKGWNDEGERNEEGMRVQVCCNGRQRPQ